MGGELATSKLHPFAPVVASDSALQRSRQSGSRQAVSRYDVVHMIVRQSAFIYL